MRFKVSALNLLTRYLEAKRRKQEILGYLIATEIIRCTLYLIKDNILPSIGEAMLM